MWRPSPQPSPAARRPARRRSSSRSSSGGASPRHKPTVAPVAESSDDDAAAKFHESVESPRASRARPARASRAPPTSPSPTRAAPPPPQRVQRISAANLPSPPPAAPSPAAPSPAARVEARVAADARPQRAGARLAAATQKEPLVAPPTLPAPRPSRAACRLRPPLCRLCRAATARPSLRPDCRRALGGGVARAVAAIGAKDPDTRARRGHADRRRRAGARWLGRCRRVAAAGAPPWFQAHRAAAGDGGDRRRFRGHRRGGDRGAACRRAAVTVLRHVPVGVPIG